MHAVDYCVLAAYFLTMIGIGIWSMRRIRVQEDFFMGGRGFGKLIQTFAAFGAGTSASDPAVTATTTFTSGMSGMWSVMYWLFVTPVYWFSGVWYRRMRHLTLGDWFVERYESKQLGGAYAVFGILYYILYGSLAFSAIGKIAAPLIGRDTLTMFGATIGIEYALVPLIGAFVLVYGLAGGLCAAYYTDLIQGLCIILLSVILIPFGLNAVVERFGDPATQSMSSGFSLIHDRLPAEHFQIVGTNASEFPLHRIVAVVIINLIGIVVTPHMIVTGGGSARTETSARVGLVTGNLLKRFCTVGWVLTTLIALALFADHPDLAADADRTWGVASKELLGPGLTGLMLACLLAALMSSIDAYMLVCSALAVRNIYVAFVHPDASERECLRVARITGFIVVAGAVLTSLFFMNVFKQLQITWVFPILFAAIFWFGLYWRRATTGAAWMTVAFVALMFFILPAIIPMLTNWESNPSYLTRNQAVETTTTRRAAPSDVARRRATIQAWEQTDPDARSSSAPEPLDVGDIISERRLIGGKSIFWSEGIKPVDEQGQPIDVAMQPIGQAVSVDEHRTTQRMDYPEGTKLRGFGNFRVEFLLYKPVLDMTKFSSAFLNTLELPLKIVLPFAVMFCCSLVTRRNSPETLDRYYAKMKCAVDADPQVDREQVEAAMSNHQALQHKKIFPDSDFEMERPSAADVGGFLATLAACFGVIGLAFWISVLGT